MVKYFAAVKHILFRRGTKLDYEHAGTFQEAIGPVIVMAQVFALMPVLGIGSKSVQDLKFKWLCFRSFYSLLIIVCLGVYAGFTIAYAFRGEFNFDAVETIIFYISIFLISIGFFNLARKWPKLMQQWQLVENKLPPLGSQKTKSLLAYRIKMITLVATSCSLVEHLLSMLSIIYYVNACPAIPDHPIKSFFYSNLAQLFYFVSFNTAAGIIGKILNILATFAWSFNDIFVMVISVALSSRFRQLNEHMLSAVKHQPTTVQFWIENRMNYRNLCKLCDAVDDTIAHTTMLCFANNLYFICVKILKSLQKKPSFTHTVYFWYSLAYLLCRTLILSLYTAEINDESKRPLIVFRSVSREFWCPELKRFSEEVTTDVVALSGMKFFQLTRSMVIAVAGTIVTYELVLMQFNKQDKVNDCYEN